VRGAAQVGVGLSSSSSSSSGHNTRQEKSALGQSCQNAEEGMPRHM
jgi:hypothetical protein